MRKIVMLVCGAWMAAFCAAPLAHAQSSEPEKVAAAQALYDEAVTAMDANDYATACPKLAEAVRLVPEGIGAKLTLAECYESSGKLASAWSQYAVAASMAERAGQADRAKQATEKAAGLRDKLAQLTIEVPEQVAAIPQLSITRRGVAVGEGQWGTALPIDVGSYDIVVTAPGYKTWTKQVEIAKDGEKVTIRVEAPLIDESAKAADARKEAAKIVYVQQQAKRPWQRPLGVTVAGIGAAGLVVGGVLGGLAIAKNDAANDGLCDANDYCKREGLALRGDAVSLGNGSTAAFVVGGALAVTGIVLIATSQAKGKETPAIPAGIAARIDIGPQSVVLRGTF